MKCFLHNDLDGRCAGSLVAKYENNYDKEDFIEVDYVKDLPYDIITSEDIVYFVDYSFSKDTIYRLEKVLKIAKKVIWIDHHISSVEALREHEYLINESNLDLFIINEKISGAGLTWMYFNDETKLDKAPKYIKLVSDYDCWVLDNKEAIKFKLSADGKNHNALSNIWKDLETNEELVDIMIKEGIVIEAYTTQEQKEYCDTYSFETKLPGYDYRILACNRKGNSLLFGDNIDKYDIVCPFVFIGNNFVYSIFTNKDNIDCKAIAESFGGGGHVRSSGFSTEKMILKKI